MKLFVISICLTVAAVGGWFLYPASAAEIRNDAGTVILEGQIQIGDYDNIRDNLIINKTYNLSSEAWCSDTYIETCPHEIYLASPGGNVAEAIKLGRLVRMLGWKTIIPALAESKDKNFGWFDLEKPSTNYVCASACFFVFIAGKYRDINISYGQPQLGIHRPFISTNDLRKLNSNQVLSASNDVRDMIEKYLKEMDVPIHYIDKMFDTPKEAISWIGEDDFSNDFSGFTPSLKEWVKSKCNNFTDIEESAWNIIKRKKHNEETAEERRLSELLQKKLLSQYECELNVQTQMPKEDWPQWRAATLHDISRACGEKSTGSLIEQLESSISDLNANTRPASVALELAQTLTRCLEVPISVNGKNEQTNANLRAPVYAIREKAIRALADGGDPKAERILANLFLLGGSTIAFDQKEALKWYGRAGKHGDSDSQELYNILSRKMSKDGNFVHDDEFTHAFVLWTQHDCPTLC